jgi:hypothetical protein
MSRCVHGKEDTEPCVRCAMAEPDKNPPLDLSGIGDVIRGEQYCAGRDAERARCRRIILKYLSNDWTANKVLEEVGE